MMMMMVMMMMMMMIDNIRINSIWGWFIMIWGWFSMTFLQSGYLDDLRWNIMLFGIPQNGAVEPLPKLHPTQPLWPGHRGIGRSDVRRSNGAESSVVWPLRGSGWSTPRRSNLRRESDRPYRVAKGVAKGAAFWLEIVENKHTPDNDIHMYLSLYIYISYVSYVYICI